MSEQRSQGLPGTRRPALWVVHSPPILGPKFKTEDISLDLAVWLSVKPGRERGPPPPPQALGIHPQSEFCGMSVCELERGRAGLPAGPSAGPLSFLPPRPPCARRGPPATCSPALPAPGPTPASGGLSKTLALGVTGARGLPKELSSEFA